MLYPNIVNSEPPSISSLVMGVIESEDRRKNPLAPYAEYQGRIVEFVEDIIMPEYIYREQREILEAIDNTNIDLTVRSGHGIGKTTALAWAAIYTISCYPMSMVVCSAPTEPQIKDILMAEIKLWINYAGDRLSQHFESFAMSVNHRIFAKNWRILGRVSNHPDNMRGFHAKYLRFIIDECSGVADEILDAVDGALTENENSGGFNQLIYVSNPGYVKSGRFYESHFDNSVETIWKRLHYSAESAERVGDRWLRKMRHKYIKGEHIYPEYYVMVKGEYPQSTIDQVCTEEWLKLALNNKIKPSGTKCFGIDIARGGANQTVMTLMQEGVQLLPQWKFSGKMNDSPQELAIAIKAEIDKCVSEDDEDDYKIVVDDTGCGWGVSGLLEDYYSNVIKIVLGSSADDKATFENNKVEMMWNLRTWCASNKLSILPDKDLESQLLKGYFEHKQNGQKRLVDAHEIIRKDGKKVKSHKNSPDELHSLALAMYPFSVMDNIGSKPVCLGQELDDIVANYYESDKAKDMMGGYGAFTGTLFKQLPIMMGIRERH